MQENNFIKIEMDLRQIVDMLLLNGTLTECSGLVHGKVGIAVFFFHYARFTNNILYADYGMDLIDGMLNQIHVNTPADYEKGIAGIGVGLDYLIRNSFLSVEDDICEDFDGRMMRAVMYDPYLDFSKYRGLIGYGRYWMTRLHYQTSSILAHECLWHIVEQIKVRFSDIVDTDQMDVFCFLHDLHMISGFERCIGILEQCRRIWDRQELDMIQCFPYLGDSIVADAVCVYLHSRYFNNSLHGEVDIVLKQIPDLDIEKAPASTGLLYGYAGEGMLRLTALDHTVMPWMNLL